MHQRQLCVQQRQKSHQCEHQDLYNQTPNDQTYYHTHAAYNNNNNNNNHLTVVCPGQPG